MTGTRLRTTPSSSPFSQVKCYRRVVSEYPAPYTEPRDVTEIWIALCEVVEAAMPLYEAGKGDQRFWDAMEALGV